MYEFLTLKEHFITVNDRDGFANRRRLWNMSLLEKVLKDQKLSEDIYVTKYPTGRFLQYIILDFDSEEDKTIALKESNRMFNYFCRHGHPCVLVDSTNKGYHLYIKISPFLFKDEGNRVMSDWGLYFEQFVRYMIRRSSNKPYKTLDMINTGAGFGGNIRLINSIHPSTGEKVHIIKGEFSKEAIPPTSLQDLAQRVAYQFCEVCDNMKARQTVKKTKVAWGEDPVEANDLREILPRIFGEDAKHYGKYSMMCCPFHNEKHPSLMVGKEGYRCLACGEHGTIHTLRKKGLVEFGLNGEVVY